MLSNLRVVRNVVHSSKRRYMASVNAVTRPLSYVCQGGRDNTRAVVSLRIRSCCRVVRDRSVDSWRTASRVKRPTVCAMWSAFPSVARAPALVSFLSSVTRTKTTNLIIYGMMYGSNTDRLVLSWDRLGNVPCKTGPRTGWSTSLHFGSTSRTRRPCPVRVSRLAWRRSEPYTASWFHEKILKHTTRDRVPSRQLTLKRISK